MFSLKIVVFVMSDEEVMCTAEFLRKSSCKYNDNKFRLPSLVKNKLLMLMENEKADKLSRKLCSSGFLTLHSGMTNATR